MKGAKQCAAALSPLMERITASSVGQHHSLPICTCSMHHPPSSCSAKPHSESEVFDSQNVCLGLCSLLFPLVAVSRKWGKLRH